MRAERFVAGDRVVVDTDALNLRRGPGLSFVVLGVLVNELALTVLGDPTAADGYRWYRVSTQEETTGWVAGIYLQLGSGEGDAVFTIGQSAVVATDYLNCRSGAGLVADVRSSLPEGVRLTILDGPFTADGYTWYEVQASDSRVGWVAGEFLAVASAEFAIGAAVRVTGGALNLRDQPGLAANIRRVMADNDVLVVRGGSEVADGYIWYRVWNYGGEGWAAGEYLRFEPNGFPPEDGAGSDLDRSLGSIELDGVGSPISSPRWRFQ